MVSSSQMILRMAAVLCILPSGLAGCKASGKEEPAAASQPPFMSAAASAPPQTPDDALPPEKTGGFDGKRAYAHVAKQVSFRPHPSGSPAITRVQEYPLAASKAYGCFVESDA